MQLYKLYDMLDDENNPEFEIVTLEQAKEWLISFWWNNPNEEQTEDDLRKLEEEIRETDASQLIEFLEGIAYSIDEFLSCDED